MQKLIIKGKKKLFGSIDISGSKNATLPILAATLLTDKAVTLKNIPLVQDVYTMINLLKFIGLNIKISKKKNILRTSSNRKLKTLAPYNLLKTMRAGVLVLGPLLAKYKKAKVSLPGGCAIGARPVNLHLFALEKLGAKIKIKNGYMHATAENGLKGAIIKFPSISVGATESAILAAVSAEGKTIISNCAIEPEIQDMIVFLKKLGCNINFIGKRKILIIGTKKFKSTSHEVIFDRIELGTYLIAAALVGTKITFFKIKTKIIETEIKLLKKMGIKMKIDKNKITVFESGKIKSVNIKTEPYPGFPTDLQAQIMVLMLRASGISKITENIFENRFMHVPELRRMGAKITTKKNAAYVTGPTNLSGAEVMATDLRASVSLALAALNADGLTVINRVYHLDRGYENLEKKLKKCKANINRV
jgi:UDP-N-acetylglucosamine 1-carboxyvinyltransferase